MTLGILCGLESEAKIARKMPVAIVACAAARPGKARQLARGLVEQGATRLISFGIAGSLDSSVRLGDVVIGSRIASASGQWTCDESWARGLAAKLPKAMRGGIYGSEKLVTTIQEKAELNNGTGCSIVDMESQCMAEVAAENGLPMAVLRAVCDDSTMPVPPFVMAAIREDGSIDVVRALMHLARHPLQAGDLFDVMRGTGRALAALEGCMEVLSEVMAAKAA
jgi:adenosylhomocysteine nucleosidase